MKKRITPKEFCEIIEKLKTAGIAGNDSELAYVLDKKITTILAYKRNGANHSIKLICEDILSKSLNKNSKYIVQKGFEIPSKRYSEPSKYPFTEMDIGDSFLVPYVELSAIKRACSKASKNNKIEGSFSVRKISEKNYRAFRVG